MSPLLTHATTRERCWGPFGLLVNHFSPLTGLLAGKVKRAEERLSIRRSLPAGVRLELNSGPAGLNSSLVSLTQGVAADHLRHAIGRDLSTCDKTGSPICVSRATHHAGEGSFHAPASATVAPLGDCSSRNRLSHFAEASGYASLLCNNSLTRAASSPEMPIYA